MRSITAYLLLFCPFLLLGQEVTYYKHVAPIIIDNCVSCHRAGEVAPFPLETYEDVSAKAKLVQFVTQTKYMPPWLADPHYRRYANERLLTEKEIATIRAWLKGGKKAGLKRDAPPTPQFAKNSFIRRKPDLVVKMQRPFRIKGNNKETFCVIKYPIEIDTDKEIECIEFVPGNRRLVHHMNVEILDIDDDVDLNKGASEVVLDGSSLQDIYKYLNVLNPNGKQPERVYYSGWVPGMTPQIYRGDLGVKLPKKCVLLVNTMHYDASPIDEIDESYFNIFFKDEPVTRKVEFVAFGSGDASSTITPKLELQPGKIQHFTSKSELAMDVSVMYVTAHMHLFGKKFKAYGVTPRRDTIPILRINEWDFNWQEFHEFNPMLRLPKGTVLHAEATYDNTVNNPYNPFNPPQTIYSFGNMETTNEMLNLIFIYLPYQPGDEKKKLE